MERMNIASMPPLTPAKKEEITKLSSFVLNRLMPIASAAISSSRTALNIRPKDELIRSTMRPMQTTVSASTWNKLEKPGMDLRPYEPFVMVSSCGAEISARMISAKPRVAIAR